jgi:hypothetical protein
MPTAKLAIGSGNQIQLVDSPSGWGNYGQVPNIVLTDTFDNPLSIDGWSYKQISFSQQNGSEVWSQGWVGGGLKFTVNGNSSLFLKKDGNVGIGTASPGAKLDVNGNIYDSGGSLIFSTTTGTHTGLGNTTGWAAIENSAGYNTLMILGSIFRNWRRTISKYLG